MLETGTHVLADLHGVDARLLKDEKRLIRAIHHALDLGGFTVVGRVSHQFTGGGNGVTGIWLLSQSHAAFHTYPERNYMALDILSCGAADPMLALRELVRELAPQAVPCAMVLRGNLMDGLSVACGEGIQTTEIAGGCEPH